MDLLKVSRLLLVITAFELLVLLVPASLAAAYRQNQTVALIVPLVVRPPDVLFILALLSMLATYFLFYHWVLPHAKEQFADDLISLALAGFFVLQNFFLFIEEALPYRFIFLSVPLLVAWYKDRQIWIRYRKTPFEAPIEDWFRKARWTAIWTLAAACLFALLMHQSSRQLIFGRQFADQSPLGSHFDIAVPGFSYLVFFLISLRSFLRTYLEFRARGPQHVRDMQAMQNSDEAREARGNSTIDSKPEPLTPNGKLRKVFISYAWGDETPEGKIRTRAVEGLYSALAEDGFQPVRDRDQIRSGELISTFIRCLTHADFVVAVISDKYLRSPYCMYEIYRLWQKFQGEADGLVQRLVPIVLPEVRIGDLRERIPYLEYWADEAEHLEALVRNPKLSPSKESWEQVRLVREFANHVDDILVFLQDVLMPRKLEAHLDDGFQAVREALRWRMEAGSS